MWPVTMWPPSRSPTARARSRLMGAPGRSAGQRGAPHRLRHGVGAEAAGAQTGDRQADAVGQDGVADARAFEHACGR